MDKLRLAEEAQERIYILREEAARKALTQAASKHEKPTTPVSPGLHNLEGGVHPICECCGKRIDVDSCRNDAAATCCSACKRAKENPADRNTYNN